MDFERLDDYQSWRIRCADLNLFIDPWLSGELEIGTQGLWLKRQHRSPAAMEPSEIGSGDLIVLTAAFADHAHRPTLQAIDRTVPVIGPASAVRLARRLGFTRTTALRSGQRIEIAGRAALTAIRPRFPYAVGSIGLLIEDLGDGVRTYLETHVAPRRPPPSLKIVDVVIAPVERVRLLGLQLAMDIDESIALAGHLGARWLLPTGTAPAASGGLIPERLLRVNGDLHAFAATAREAFRGGCGRLLVPGEVLHVGPALANGDSEA